MEKIVDIEKVREVLDTLVECFKDEAKIIKVGTAKWTNGLTYEPQEVEDIYFLGWQSSCRPLLICSVLIDDETEYVITDEFNHVNLSGECDVKYYSINGDGKIIPENCNIKIRGQEFCSAITANHIYEADAADMAVLLKATLSNQNFDSAFHDYESVDNRYMDKAVMCAKTGRTLLKNNSSPLEMISACNSGVLRNVGISDLKRVLKNIVLGKDELWVKVRTDRSYTKIKRKDFNKVCCSEYYPVYDYEAIQAMGIEISADKYGLGVYGLGSAGTAILDQVCRANWFKEIYLCDFDTVEAKNMINQWYTREDIGSKKVVASARHIDALRRTGAGIVFTNYHVEYDENTFQDIVLGDKIFKYVVSGFDSIDARIDFLNEILSGRLKAEYLIDCRYLDLACSVYFIDLKKPEEVEFYKANLEMDAELITQRNAKEKLTFEEFVDWFSRKGYFMRNCFLCRRDLLDEIKAGLTCKLRQEFAYTECGCPACKDYLYKLYLASYPNSNISKSDASCVKYNYIDIYKYVGAIVFGAIRKIENDNKKPFSLVEAETDVNGLPNCMVVRG